jgi:hypothetical protein
MKNGTNKQVKENQKMFGRRIKQLDHILKDNTFLVDSGYREFIVSMYKALVNGRKITPKMESAITKVVKSYANHNNPEHRKQKLEYIENTISKINKIKRKLHECNYTSSYKYNSEYFLKSIERQVWERGKLSVKQRKALNRMYTQFKKKLEKSEKKP